MTKDLTLIILGVALCYAYFYWEAYINKKEIIKAIRMESRIPLISDVGYKNLIKFVRKLFKEYRSE